MEEQLLCLFDVDGTLTKPRQVIDQEMLKFLLTDVKSRCVIGLVGGSSIDMIVEQMGGESHSPTDFRYLFAENGLDAYKEGKLISKQVLSKFLGEVKLQNLINYSLRYMSELNLPVKRGTFVQYRTGMINLCPVGRSCSQEERIEFAAYDDKHKIREKFIAYLEDKMPDSGLQFAIGGQISIDVFPKGWDKTYCLRFVEEEFKGRIHFFGDKTSPGGNDYEIYSDPRVIGHTVTSPEDTKAQLRKLLKIV